MKYKWFWISLAAWILFGTIFSAWALIYSPFKLEWSEPARFDADLNGFKETNTVDTVSGSLEKSLQETRNQWFGEGWSCPSGGANLLPFLMHADDHNLLSPHAYVTMFQKGGFYRILCFYNDYRRNQTYRLISEIPKAAFDSKSALARWDFPLRPPPEALSPYCSGFKDFQIAVWSLPAGGNPVDRFISFCSGQGFDGRPVKSDRSGKTIILRRGPVRLIAFLDTEGKKNAISIVRFSGL